MRLRLKHHAHGPVCTCFSCREERCEVRLVELCASERTSRGRKRRLEKRLWRQLARCDRQRETFLRGHARRATYEATTMVLLDEDASDQVIVEWVPSQFERGLFKLADAPPFFVKPA